MNTLKHICHFRYIVIGVASFGDSKPEDCGKNPAGFARITPKVLSWIKKTTRLSLVISSKGPSVRDQGHLMGEYQFDSRINSFRQRSSSQIGEPSYLYQFSQNTWIVGPIVNSSRGSLYSTYSNINNSQSVPSIYWRYKTSLNTWKLDDNIRVEYGGINACDKI